MITTGTDRVVGAASAIGLVLTLALTSCAGEGPINLPSPTGSITASLPSPTRTPSRSATATPSESPSRSESPAVSETPAESETPEASETPAESETPEASETPAESETPDASETPAESETASPPPAADEDGAGDSSEDEGLPSWFWWVVGGLVLLGGALAAVLIPRARRRSAWDTDLEAARGEVAWCARELVPALQQSGSPAEVAGAWHVSGQRVTLAEDRLTALEASAPDEVRQGRARTLRDAARSARLGLDRLVVSRDPTSMSSDLAAISATLTQALAPGDRPA